MDFGIPSITAITVICYLVTRAVKNTSLDNKWLPVISGVIGGVLGIPAMLSIQDFPATDYITAIAIGIVSGLAATGVNQIYKQLIKTETDSKTKTVESGE